MKGHPIRSMTGFARVRKASPDGEIVLSLKSVNHRGLDLRFHLPPEFDVFENSLRRAIHRRIGRGHLEIRLSLERLRKIGAFSFDPALLDAYVTAFRQAAAAHNLSAEPDLNAAFRIPGIFGDSREQEPDAALEGLLMQALEEAIDALDRFREREGGEIAGGMREQNEMIHAFAREMAEIRTRALPDYRSRLMDRLQELLSGAGREAQNVEPQRLAQEVALLVDRSDIGEETERLEIHSRQLREIIGGGGEIGKKLDFLLQEMNRETNTILAKTGGAGEYGMRLTDLALAAKSAIEKIREQALNLE